MTTDFDVYNGHGPCMDGHAALAIAWNQQPQAVKDYLAQFGGAYSETPKPFIRGAPHPNSPAGALKIMQEWKLEGYKPVVFCTAEPDCLLPEELIKGKRVFITDRDPGAAGLQQLAEHAAYAMILDHHGTFAHSREAFLKNREDLKLLPVVASTDLKVLTPNVHYIWKPEKTNSGASLTWQYFHRRTPIPPFVESVQIQDTYNFSQNPALHAKETREALMARRAFTSYPGTARYLTDFPLEDLIREGAPALKLKDGLAGAMAAQASIGYILARNVDVSTKIRTSEDSDKQSAINVSLIETDASIPSTQFNPLTKSELQVIGIKPTSTAPGVSARQRSKQPSHTSMLRPFDEKSPDYGHMTIKLAKDIIIDPVHGLGMGAPWDTDDLTTYTVLYANTPIMTNETLIIMRERHEERRKKDSSLPEVDFCCGWYYEASEGIVKVGLRCPREGLKLGYIARGIPNIIKGGGHDESAAFRFAGIDNLHKFFLPTKPQVISELAERQLELTAVDTLPLPTVKAD